MFKFLGKAFALLVLSIFFISSAQARDYKEGLDYEIRATNKTVEPEIREFFSFFCSHCFAMEKPFSQWNKEEVKTYASLKNVDISNTKNIGEARSIIKQSIDKE